MWFYVLILFVIWVVADRFLINRDFYKYRYQTPGPKFSVPIFGTVGPAILEFSNQKLNDFFKTSMEIVKKYGFLCEFNVFRRIVYLISSPREMEAILSSYSALEKGVAYEFLVPWLGRDGLITSNGGESWKSHRKMLTPAFHFTILTGFVDIFNKNSQILCDILESKIGEEPFNIYPYIQLAALDNIYETSMGVYAGVQKNSDTKFVRAIKDVSKAVIERVFGSYSRSNFIYQFTSMYQTEKIALDVLGKTTEEVIVERKKQIEPESSGLPESDSTESFGQKKRFAFLDLMLSEAGKGNLDIQAIKDEVATFMFAGHDTISSAITSCVYELASHPEIQEKAYHEQLEMFGDSDRPATISELGEMNYLAKVIKETARLYPSVPGIARKSSAPIALNDKVTAPAGSQFILYIYALHRNPEVWDDPDTFNPENFSVEACQKRHPFAYVPFSAGPRNCIGQRYAMLEIKSTVSAILRRFKVLTSPRAEHKIHPIIEVVLISKTGHHVILQRRK